MEEARRFGSQLQNGAGKMNMDFHSQKECSARLARGSLLLFSMFAGGIPIGYNFHVNMGIWSFDEARYSLTNAFGSARGLPGALLQGHDKPRRIGWQQEQLKALQWNLR